MLNSHSDHFNFLSLLKTHGNHTNKKKAKIMAEKNWVVIRGSWRPPTTNLHMQNQSTKYLRTICPITKMIKIMGQLLPTIQMHGASEQRRSN
jgi:hypothetical protein